MKLWRLLIGVPLLFAAAGALFTFIYYYVPGLQSNSAASWFAPVGVTIDYGFKNGVVHHPSWDKAMATAPFNAVIYAIAGYIVGFVIALVKSRH